MMVFDRRNAREDSALIYMHDAWGAREGLGSHWLMACPYVEWTCPTTGPSFSCKTSGHSHEGKPRRLTGERKGPHDSESGGGFGVFPFAGSR